MELSSALNQRLSELQEWREEAVLTIRKAFTFDDIAFDLAELTPVLDTGFVIAAKDAGYGFYRRFKASDNSREDSWILAYPDAKTRQIVVTKRIDGRVSKTRINTFMTIYELKPNPVRELQNEIIEFLALVILKAKPIDW